MSNIRNEVFNDTNNLLTLTLFINRLAIRLILPLPYVEIY